MLRREMRERREYIYRKHKEESEAKMRDRKEKLHTARKGDCGCNQK